MTAYPNSPGFVARDTSIAAAKDIAPSASAMAEAVYDLILERPRSCWEIEKITGYAHQTASARIRELGLKGRIIDSGERGRSGANKPVIIWKVNPTPDVIPPSTRRKKARTDAPIRLALRQTIDGLLPQIPDWMPTTLIEHSDEDGEGGALRPETAPAHLRWMIKHCLDHLEEWPVDKSSRWIGYVQGVLAAKSKDFSVTAERDRTRPFFHEAYIAAGSRVPETKEGPGR